MRVEIEGGSPRHTEARRLVTEGSTQVCGQVWPEWRWVHMGVMGGDDGVGGERMVEVGAREEWVKLEMRG